MIHTLYQYRFELYFFTILLILFGGLVFPAELFQNVIGPILFILSITNGILLVSKNKKLMWFFSALFFGALLAFAIRLILGSEEPLSEFSGMGIFLIFYSAVTLELILQIWKASVVSRKVIFGLMCGYISLGLLAYFAFIAIETASPGSFQGVSILGESAVDGRAKLMYFSYISLMTIGYGEIIPLNTLAQKAVILFGLAGQFYLVIVTATVVGKYISQTEKSKRS